MKGKLIKLFFKTYNKKYNDKHNRIREDILLYLSNITEDKLLEFNNKYYLKWKLLYEKWNETIKSLCNTNYTGYKVEKKGGRSTSYDYVINYYNNNSIILTKYIEFKYNCFNIEKLPEFLQVSTKNFMIDTLENSYEYYFYQNYLSNIITNVYKRFKINNIDNNEYFKYIYQDKYSKHDFFKDLYENEKLLNNDEIKLKDEYVNNSIKSYLENYHNKLNIKVFLDKVVNTQKDKVFVLWYKDEFRVFDSIIEKEANLDIENYKINFDKNNLYVSNKNVTYKLLLRWKNHKGILNPAWQISFKINK